MMSRVADGRIVASAAGANKGRSEETCVPAAFAHNDGQAAPDNGPAPSRLRRIDDLVMAMSAQDDAERLVRVFAGQGDFLVRRDGFLSVSRRDLVAPHYRVTRSWRWREPINPWTEAHRLPLFDRGLLGELLYVGKPAVLNRLEVEPDDPAAEHLEGMRSLACVPSYDHGRPLNMAVALSRQPDAFTATDLENLLLQVNLLGRAVNNLVLAQQLDEAYRKLDDEMRQAGRVQRALLPEELPAIDGLDLGASYVTSSRAGGDYYQVLPLPEGRWGLFLADVSGHGVGAAVGTVMLHTLLHSCPDRGAPPSRALAYLNHHLRTVAPEGMFATAIYGVYDPAGRRLTYAVAGHPLPLLRRHRAVGEVERAGGLPLGVLKDATWAENEVTLRPGEALLLYTDGISEGMNAAGEMFGKERLIDAVRLGPLRAQRLVQHVEWLYRDYRGDLPDLDDRTLLAAVAVP
jgi:sigma-B regulation protein RsbU (phosphoserine phosphatase)